MKKIYISYLNIHLFQASYFKINIFHFFLILCVGLAGSQFSNFRLNTSLDTALKIFF